MLSSARTYGLLRQILPLPGRSHLYEEFGGSIRSEKEALVDLRRLDEKLQDYRERNSLADGEVTVTLGIDAFAFRSFGSPNLGLGRLHRRKLLFQLRETLPTITAFCFL